MEREKGRDLKRNGVKFFSSSSSSSNGKRQQKALSGHVSMPPITSPSSSLSGSNNNVNGKGEGDAMERWKKERAKSMRWSLTNDDERGGSRVNGVNGGGSEGEDGYGFRQSVKINGSLSGRKRFNCHGKVSEELNAVDPAVVPRRLRSAINKRSRHSESPPLPDSNRKKLHHGLNGTQVSNGYKAEIFKQNSIYDLVTKDEQEATEALLALASSTGLLKPVKIKEDKRMFEENCESKATSASLSEASKGDGNKYMRPCNGIRVTNPSSCVEELREEPEKVTVSALEQPAASVSQKFSAVENRTSQRGFRTTAILSNNEEGKDTTSLGDAMNSSNIVATSVPHLSGNGCVLQPVQLDAPSLHKQDIALWPLGSTSIERDVLPVKEKTDSGINHFSQKETTPDVRSGLLSRGHAHLTIPNSTTAAERPSSTRHDLLSEKLSLAPADRKRSWSRCITHVYISHLIQNYQGSVKKQKSPLVNQSKAKEATNSKIQASSEAVASRNSTVPPLSNGSVIEKNMLEGTNRMLRDERLLHAQQASSTISGAYSQHKQGCDFLPFSAAGEAMNSGNMMNSSGQLHVPYLSHQSVLPFPFPRGPYNSHYQDQLAAAASQQMQLQLPQYIGSSSLYGPHMAHAATTKQQQQQQQMWQAHMAQYRSSPQGFPKWQQNGKQHDPTTPSLLPSPSMYPQGVSYHSANPHHPQQHHISIPSSSSSALPSRTHQQQQQQQQNGGGHSPKHSSQLQLLCNMQHL